MDEKFLKPYNPSETEERIYKIWEASGFFNPDICIKSGVTDENAEPFSIVLPPPNVTGTLHTGHSFMLAIEDVMVRFHRMKGEKTLWIPGTDHAAIATESVVVKKLSKEGTSKHDLGREKFLEEVNAFAANSHTTIVSQLRKMGASLDWSREAFTLDAKREKAVYTAFKKMYDDGLIYRGERVINWDPKSQTTVSDDEIEYEEETTKFYYFKYGPFVIGTARPETKFGDKYVVVHPNDERYKTYKNGQKIELEWINGPITATVIKDEAIDMEFGTGAMTITPWHSAVDFEIAERHNLDKEQIIDKYGKLLPVAGEFAGMKIAEAREKIVEKLRSKGLVEKIEENYVHQKAISQRGGGTIEPQIMAQWFVDVNKKIPSWKNYLGLGNSLKDLMIKVVKSGKVKILPERFNKIYFNWVNNLRDWNISRQLWYGHRIPVWYDKDNNIYVSETATVYLARHGQSEFNISKTFWTQKEADTTSLTEKGREDAKILAISLKNKKITRIICSNLLRSKQTAEIVAKELGINTIEIETWNELQEVRIGENKGKEKPANYNPLRFSIENNIQTLEEIELQAKSILHKIKNLKDKGNVLVVGHGAINSAVVATSKNLPKEKFIEHMEQHQALGLQKNGSYYEISFTIRPGENFTQDPDTLDTWFSSGLWTFSTLGWPDKTKDLATYHPTSVIETGYDIIFFWVARMILMSGYLLDEVPFKTVYLHGMVLDKNGKKMSKSNPETAVDPIETIHKYGADALRMAMIIGTGPGQDVTLSEDKIRAYGKFGNKMWNASRFVIESLGGLKPEAVSFKSEHRKYQDELTELIKEVTREMNEFKFYLAGEKLYHYFWHTFADKIIEELKPAINGSDESLKQSALATCSLQLETLLKLLHPFMPFITEEIWNSLPRTNKNLLMVEKWPK